LGYVRLTLHNEFKLDLNDLQVGAYNLRIVIDDEIITRKIILIE